MNCTDLENHDCARCGTHIQFDTPIENKRKYSLTNRRKQKVCLVKLDDCYFEFGEHKTCDYMFVLCEQNRIILVELKGTDYRKAVAQINTVLSHLRQDITGMIVDARLVMSKVKSQRIIKTDPEVRKLRKKLKRMGGDLSWTSGQGAESI